MFCRGLIKGTLMEIKKLHKDGGYSQKNKSWKFHIPSLYDSGVAHIRILVFWYESKPEKNGLVLLLFLFPKPLLSKQIEH